MNPMTSDFDKLQQSPRHLARWQQAQQELMSGRPDVALAAYRSLLKQFPGVAGLWFELGLAAVKQLEFDEANRAFQRTAELGPRDVSMLILLGQQYHQMRRLDQARVFFQRAAAADASSIPAQLSLANWFERERRLDDAWACVEACAARHPQNAQVLCVKALLLHRQGRNTEAETLLRDLIKTGLPDFHLDYAVRHQLAVVLDALGQYAEAMQQLRAAKESLRRTANVAKLEQDYDHADQRRRELLAELKPQTIQRWRREGTALPLRHRLAFLGGHPRSGTTLLEQILGAHPAIAAFDEPMAFVHEILEMLAPLNATTSLTVNRLDNLTTAQRAQFQQRYLKSLSREGTGGPGDGIVAGQKSVANSRTASLAADFSRPEGAHRPARPARRDRQLLFSETNAERDERQFLESRTDGQTLRRPHGCLAAAARTGRLRLDGIALRGHRQQPGIRGPPRHRILRLQWHERQANFYEAARAKFVFAPTYNDVTQPVHRRAVGRWHHYAEALAPLDERLAPYCRAFGYT